MVGVGSRSGGVTRYHRRCGHCPPPLPSLSLPAAAEDCTGAANSVIVVVVVGVVVGVVKATGQAACLSVGSPSEEG